MKSNGFDKTISDNITTSTNKDEDRFVGVIYKDDKLSIVTPIGFDMKKPTNSEEKSVFRNDLKLLISIIRKYYTIRDKNDLNRNMERVVNSYGYNKKFNNFPIYSYDYLIQDYINNGYYKEEDILYKESNSGKINWNKTIKNEKSFFDNDNLFFLKFFRRKNSVLDSELITLLHKTCVYESFEKWGFIYFDKNFSEKPEIDIKKSTKYISLLKQKISKTYSDKHKELFIHMLNVIEHNARFSNNVEYKYGVEYYHPVWEKMIDIAFGIEPYEKAKFYPNAKWHLLNSVEYNASNLRPDTIMKYNDEYYIIDAKYYGKDDNEVQRLPDTSDINKQITYGKYFEEISGNEPYNVFLIPSNDEKNIKYIGYADLNEVLKSKSKKYARISTLLVNTRLLMNLKFNKASDELKDKLVKEINEVIDYKKDMEIINIDNKYIQFKQVCEDNNIWDQQLAAHIDISVFINIYNKIGAVIDKFIKDNK